MARVNSNRLSGLFFFRIVLCCPGSEELVIFICAFIGALIGFLWYNAYPAQVFMGDTGDMSLWTLCADKYRVREYIHEKGLDDTLVKLYGVWEKAEDVPVPA